MSFCDLAVTEWVRSKTTRCRKPLTSHDRYPAPCARYAVRCSGKRAAVAAVIGIAALALPACTAGPLYGTGSNSISAALSPGGQLADLRGRIAVSIADTRTAQTVRNPLLLHLNQGQRVRDPLYEVRLTVNGRETGIAIEQGGELTSSLYRMNATYKLVRLAGGTVVDSGTRTTTIPFDRTRQLFQSQRALIDARDQAGEDIAAKLEIPIVKALQTAETQRLSAARGPAQ